jgi:hypothetical protein
MSHNQFEGEDESLRRLLLATKPAPPLPPRFQQAVWRRIEQAESAGEPVSPLAWLDLWIERLLRPRYALAAFTAMLLLGGLAGVRTGVAAAKHSAQQRYVASVAPYTVR